MEFKGTIILTTYNNADTIETCLNCMAKQSCIGEFDLIVHDDCSTDETVDLIRNHSISDLVSALTIIEKKENYYQKNKDFLFVRNCMELSRSRWIFFAEADDFWLDKNKLENQLQFLLDGKRSFSCHTIERVVDGQLGSPVVVESTNHANGMLYVKPAKIVKTGGGAVHYSTVAIDKFIFDDDIWRVIFGFHAVDILLQYFIADKIDSFEFLPISSIRLIRSRGSWSAYSKGADNRVSYRIALAEYIAENKSIFEQNRYYRQFLGKYFIENVKLVVLYPKHSFKLFQASLKLLWKIC